LKNLIFSLYKTLFFSNTCRYADVVLPGAPSLEKEGLSPARSGASRALPSSRSTRGLPAGLEDHSGRRQFLEQGGTISTRLTVMDEISVADAAVCWGEYERSEGYKSLQWPVAADGTDEPLLYTKRFAFPDGKAGCFQSHGLA